MQTRGSKPRPRSVKTAPKIEIKTPNLNKAKEQQKKAKFGK